MSWQLGIQLIQIGRIIFASQEGTPQEGSQWSERRWPRLEILQKKFALTN